MAEDQKKDKLIDNSNDYCERHVRQDALIEKMERPEPWPEPPPPQRDERAKEKK